MPIPQIIRVDPLDLQKSRRIGISLPFNKTTGVFSSTFSTKDQTKSNLINLLLTAKKERVNNPEFGSDIWKSLFEPMTDTLINTIKERTLTSINTYIREIIVTSMDIIPNPDVHSVSIAISYKFKISGDTDRIFVDFSTIT
jgi:phage baseplate assembly protein W